MSLLEEIVAGQVLSEKDLCLTKNYIVNSMDKIRDQKPRNLYRRILNQSIETRS